MAARVVFNSADVTGALTAQKVAVIVRDNKLTITKRGGATLVQAVPVKRVERLSNRQWHIVADDDTVYDVTKRKDCGCGG